MLMNDQLRQNVTARARKVRHMLQSMDGSKYLVSLPGNENLTLIEYAARLMKVLETGSKVEAAHLLSAVV